MVGCAVMISTLNVGARYFCMILLVVGPFVGLNVSHSAYESHLFFAYDLNSFKSLGRLQLYLALVPSVPP